MTDLLADYISLHSEPEPEYLTSLVRLTHLRMVNGRMCSGHIQGRLLKMLTAMLRPRRVLELGTFSGYSALCIAEALTDGAELHTVEHNDELEDFLTEAFGKAPAEIASRIHLHFGEAKEMISRLPGEFDMVFVDADKREYADYYRLLKPRLSQGGVIIADNTLWDGHVVEPARRDAQTEGIRRFNDLVAADPDVSAVIIPLRDGLTLIRKN